MTADGDQQGGGRCPLAQTRDQFLAQEANFLKSPAARSLLLEAKEVSERLHFSNTPNDIRLHNVSYVVQQSVTSSGEARIRTVANISITYKIYQAMKSLWWCRNKSKKQNEGNSNVIKTVERRILKNINLKFESNKMYLVLGEPGSGKTTLLKAIAGLLQEDSNKVLNGNITINGTILKCKTGWKDVVSYIDSQDRHPPYSTVLETVSFAWQHKRGGTHRFVSTPKNDAELNEYISRLDKEQFLVKKVLQLMGLSHVQDSIVGNAENVRGVSGGERRRVTTSEALATLTPVLCMDEISTGLDTAATNDICRLLSRTTKLLHSVKIMSLLQPPPETFACFDEVILLHDGQVIYSGPVSDVIGYFQNLGYVLPTRMDPSDWLQLLPTSEGAKFYKGVANVDVNNIDDDAAEVGSGGGTKTNLSVEDLVNAYRTSEIGRTRLAEFGSQNEDVADDIAACHSIRMNFKHASVLKAIYLNTIRGMTLWSRDTDFLKKKVLGALTIALINGIVFWQVDDVNGVLGAMLQTGGVIAGYFVLVAGHIEHRRVVNKDLDANLYPSWTYVIGKVISEIPLLLIDLFCTAAVIYWCAGLGGSGMQLAKNFFLFLLIHFCHGFSGYQLCSFFTAISPDEGAATGLISLAFVFLNLFSGFAIQPTVIPDFLIWIYWSNFYAWGFRSVVVNEFLSNEYDTVVFDGQTEGEVTLSFFGFLYEGEPFTTEWVGYGILYNVAFSMFFIALTSIATDKFRYNEGASTSSTDDRKKEEGASLEHVSMKKSDTNKQALLPFPRVNLTFQNVRYTVDSKSTGEPLHLLNDITGFVAAGKVTALMGSSGAGKTTLMDVLAQRKSSGVIEGDIRVNGHELVRKDFEKAVGYVEQFPFLSSVLTIRETIEFSARLRLDEHVVNKRLRAAYVTEIIESLELTSKENTLVANISFEQKKRLAIAVEVAANPSVLFLDEPTSGLSTRGAALVINILRSLAHEGRAICCTIHQPSSKLFFLFDRLLLLKRGGETVFFGDLGHESTSLISYFEQYGPTQKIQPGENPATWMLNIIGAGTAVQMVTDYAKGYHESDLRNKNVQELSRLVALATSENKLTSTKLTSELSQFAALLGKEMTRNFRLPGYNYVRFILYVIFAIIFGLAYAGGGLPEDENEMRSRVTTIFVVLTVIGPLNMYFSGPVFELERDVFYRHKDTNMYSPWINVLALTVAEFPYIIAANIGFCAVFYFLLGFEADAVKFLWFFLIMTLHNTLHTYVGQVVATFLNAAQGGTVIMVFISLENVFAGVTLYPQLMQVWLRWLYWSTPQHYVIEGILLSQYQNSDARITPFPGSPFFEYVASVCNVSDPTNDCTGTAEEWFEATFDGYWSADNLLSDTMYLLGAIVLLRIAMVWGLTFVDLRVK
mmetsp:Transcript_18426/g.27360  ORF Transcript_18426/g.27360 Transcript_18426/m.27360 type:complete len:1393 (-) Transcript_18426:1399-5577(-)